MLARLMVYRVIVIQNINPFIVIPKQEWIQNKSLTFNIMAVMESYSLVIHAHNTDIFYCIN